MAAILVVVVSYHGKTNFPQLHTTNKALLTRGGAHVIPSPSRTEDHVFPYRVSCHAANDISRKRSHGIAKIRLSSAVLLLVLVVGMSSFLPVRRGTVRFLNSRKPVRTPK
jgi:hypothetical protein